MKRILLAVLVLFFWVAASFAAVDINTADQQALESIPGIGQTKAEAIIKYRQEHGRFKSVDELTNVKGIGAKSLEKIKGLVEVGAK